MVKGVPFCLLVLLYPLTFLSNINAYPKSDFLEDGDGLEQEIEDPLQPFDWLDEERENFKPRREEVLQKVQEVCDRIDNLAITLLSSRACIVICICDNLNLKCSRLRDLCSFLLHLNILVS